MTYRHICTNMVLQSNWGVPLNTLLKNQINMTNFEVLEGMLSEINTLTGKKAKLYKDYLGFFVIGLSDNSAMNAKCMKSYLKGYLEGFKAKEGEQ